MYELIRKPFYDKFMELCSNSTSSIKLCSPFVKTNIIEEVIENTNKNINLSLITNINLNSLCKGGLDLDALELLANRKAPIINSQKLHAKIYIFDNKKCALTSANLTNSGLKTNVEYGILVDDINQINTIIKDYNSISKYGLNGEIKKEQLERIRKLIDAFNQQSTSPIDTTSENLLSDIISVNNSFLDNHFTGWQKFLINIIEDFNKDVFSTKDFKNIEYKLREYAPNSKTPLRTVNRVLQELRDVGLIKFLGNGKYRKLWQNL